jgi:hypothetical protein
MKASIAHGSSSPAIRSRTCWSIFGQRGVALRGGPPRGLSDHDVPAQRDRRRPVIPSAVSAAAHTTAASACW